MPTDKKISNLILNEMTKEKYEELKAAGQISGDEFYMITDDGGGGLSEEDIVNLVFITLDDIHEICTPAPEDPEDPGTGEGGEDPDPEDPGTGEGGEDPDPEDPGTGEGGEDPDPEDPGTGEGGEDPEITYPPNTFQKVRNFQDGKEYILLFGYNGAYYCLSNEAFNDWTVKAAPVSEVTSTSAQITFTTVPVLFTAVTSGDGFVLSNGSNNVVGSASSGGTSLKVNTSAGTVFTVDTSDMGGFDSDEIIAKVDDQAVWIRAALNSQSCCLKFESANTSIGIDYKDRDATYSTGFLSFVLYEKIS